LPGALIGLEGMFYRKRRVQQYVPQVLG